MHCLSIELGKLLQQPSLGSIIYGGNTNPADILSKHWGYTRIWKLLQPLLFRRGDNKDINVLGLYKAPGSVMDFKQKRSGKNHTRMLDQFDPLHAVLQNSLPGIHLPNTFTNIPMYQTSNE